MLYGGYNRAPPTDSIQIDPFQRGQTVSTQEQSTEVQEGLTPVRGSMSWYKCLRSWIKLGTEHP